MYRRNPDLLSRHNSRLLIVDMQEKLLPHIAGHEAVLKNALKLVKAAELLGLPYTATEQYPKGLGPTVAPLAERIPDRPSKIRFSAAECLQWDFCRTEDTRRSIVIAGIEAHICVLQTACDLEAMGYNPVVVADAVGSRTPLDREIALRRLDRYGVTNVTTESVLFEWCEQAGTSEFKAISLLVKEG